LESFSHEWGAYEYDGILWEANYEDLERRFLREMSLSSKAEHLNFLEIGCGIGISTHLAQKNYNVDAVGVDVSQSVFQAANHYRGNPFLHFVQASVFRLPFEKYFFDAVYSRGVLHHTYSTFDAVKTLSFFCGPGAQFYLWVYGKASINDNAFRRLIYFLESICRPILQRRPNGMFAKTSLGFFALGYLGFNGLRRLRDSRVQKYNLSRAIHAARDRFTPKYAHRHDPAEVKEWFRQLGFGEVEVVDWKLMPSVEQDDYRRNIGVRGKRLTGDSSSLGIANAS
jgi:ubiquinone/menaquinone biosynthesis C-methylase UbiE